MGEQFGAWLRAHRIRRGLTLRDVERISQGMISNPYLSQLEGGQISNPSVIKLHALSAALALDFAEVCEMACADEEPKAPPPVCPTCRRIWLEASDHD